MTSNLFSNIPKKLPNELFETLASSTNIKIERIVSRGHSTEKESWYNQEWHEWIILLQGEACLEFEKWSEGDRQIVHFDGAYERSNKCVMRSSYQSGILSKE